MILYLASPYSHPNAAVREIRFRDACRAAAKLMRLGCAVFSPIAHSHCICTHGLPTDWRFWESLDRAQLERCDEVVVLMLDGWLESEGVQAEIRIAEQLGKPVRYLEPEATVSPTLATRAKETQG